MKTYVRVTISHKGNYKNGIARHWLIDLTEDQIHQIYDQMKKDKRPSQDHFCIIFTDECGMGGGRWNKEIQEIVESVPVLNYDECRRGDREKRSDLHYKYCKLIHQ